jgi:hypothetical protein
MNGRKAKLLRREGLRKVKVVPKQSADYDHGQNFAFDKELYRERRARGLRGTPKPAVVVQTIFDDKGEVIAHLPISTKLPSNPRFGGGFNRPQPRSTKTEEPMAMPQQLQARSQGRGD